MKDFNISLFLGCCVISLGIIIAGFLIADKIPPVISGSFTGGLSGSITDSSYEFGEYLSQYSASAFLSVSDDKFINFIQSGELAGTYTVIEGDYVFSKTKLSEWAENRIGNK